MDTDNKKIANCALALKKYLKVSRADIDNSREWDEFSRLHAILSDREIIELRECYRAK